MRLSGPENLMFRPENPAENPAFLEQELHLYISIYRFSISKNSWWVTFPSFGQSLVLWDQWEFSNWEFMGNLPIVYFIDIPIDIPGNDMIFQLIFQWYNPYVFSHTLW